MKIGVGKDGMSFRWIMRIIRLATRSDFIFFSVDHVSKGIPFMDWHNVDSGAIIIFFTSGPRPTSLTSHQQHIKTILALLDALSVDSTWQRSKSTLMWNLIRLITLQAHDENTCRFTTRIIWPWALNNDVSAFHREQFLLSPENILNKVIEENREIASNYLSKQNFRDLCETNKA